MKKRRIRNSGLIMSFLLSVFFNLRWTVPAWILLGLHFWLKISIWWSLACFAAFLVIILLRCIVFSSLVSAGSYNDREKPNLNPYSAKLSDILPDKKNKKSGEK